MVLTLVLWCVSCDMFTITEKEFLMVDNVVGTISELYPPHGSNMADPAPLLECEDKEKASFYKIQISDYAGFVDSLIIYEKELTESQYQLPSNLAGNKNYYWRIRMYDGAGNPGTWNGPWRVRICTKVPDPQYPYPNWVLDTAPLLIWEDILDVNEYWIQVNDSNDFSETVLIDELNIPVSEYQITLPLEVGYHYWRVRFKNPEGEWEGWSSIYRFYFSIGTPDFVTPEDGEVISDSTPFIDWKDYDAASAFHLQVADTDEFSNTLYIDDETITTSEFEFTDDLDYGQYYCRLRVQNKEGVWGSWGNTLTFQITDPSETQDE